LPGRLFLVGMDIYGNHLSAAGRMKQSRVIRKAKVTSYPVQCRGVSHGLGFEIFGSTDSGQAPDERAVLVSLDVLGYLADRPLSGLEGCPGNMRGNNQPWYVRVQQGV
jgi:hypothetical protein